MNVDRLPLLEDLLQALKYNDESLVQELVSALRSGASFQAVARSLLQNVSNLPNNRTDLNSILELAGRLCDRPSILDHAALPSAHSNSSSPDSFQVRAVPQICDTKRPPRCDEHTHVEEWSDRYLC